MDVGERTPLKSGEKHTREKERKNLSLVPLMSIFHTHIKVAKQISTPKESGAPSGRKVTD